MHWFVWHSMLSHWCLLLFISPLACIWSRSSRIYHWPLHNSIGRSIVGNRLGRIWFKLSSYICNAIGSNEKDINFLLPAIFWGLITTHESTFTSTSILEMLENIIGVPALIQISTFALQLAAIFLDFEHVSRSLQIFLTISHDLMSQTNSSTQPDTS